MEKSTTERYYEILLPKHNELFTIRKLQIIHILYLCRSTVGARVIPTINCLHLLIVIIINKKVMNL